MIDWLGTPVLSLSTVEIRWLHVLAVALAAVLAVIARRTRRSPLGWFAASLLAFVITSELTGLLVPPSELSPGEEAGAAYTLWSDAEFRADTGLLLVVIVVSILVTVAVGRLMRAGTLLRVTRTGETIPAAPQWQRQLSAGISALVLTFPVIIWLWVVLKLVFESDYHAIILPFLLFVGIVVVTGLLASRLEDERRTIALGLLGLGLVIGQVIYNETRPPSTSFFEPDGTVPFFLILIPFLLGLVGAAIITGNLARREIVLMGWQLGLLAWLAAVLGFFVMYMGYYDYYTSYAFDLGAVFDSPIRFLVALLKQYYRVVPGDIAAENNVANMDAWRIALKTFGGLAAWGAVAAVFARQVRTHAEPISARHIASLLRTSNLTLAQKRTLLAFVLIMPAVVLRTFTTFYPFVQSVILSVQRYNPAFPPRRYIDFRNFEKLSTDLVVRESLEFTLLFVFVSTLFQMILGLAIAHLLNAQFRLRGLARTISLIPWAVPMVVAAIGFRWMFDDQFGMIPDLLRRVGYDGKWLVDPENARLAVTTVNIWKSTPFAALLLLAGLQGVNEDLYEAARVDGANWFHALRFITVPMLMPIIVTVSMFLLVWQLAVFDLPFAMTGGAPGFSTTVVAQKIYLEINSLNYSFAAAVSIFLVGVVSIIGGAGLYVLRRVEVKA